MIPVNANVRTARREELKAVRVLALTAHHQYREVLLPEDRQRMERGVARIAEVAGEGTLFVAEAGGGLVGAVVYLPPGSPKPDIFRREWAAIRMLSVLPEHRGRGVGRRLSEGCIRRAGRDGAEKIALHTGEFMVAARRLYDRLGFEVVREIEPRFGSRYWVYARSIPL